MAKKKTNIVRDPKQLKEDLLKSRPARPEKNKVEGKVAESEDLYLDWEQLDEKVSVSGYVKVFSSTVVLVLPVEGVIESSLSGILRDLDSNVTRIAMKDGEYVFSHIGPAEFVDGEYQFIRLNYEISQ